ncbi:MAG TPA: heterodisulfide reductase-related iron-sulfur binding cluster [Streptosporangiaceae bacterium]|jgi:glycolate oxidase iron-sulfur subunit
MDSTNPLDPHGELSDIVSDCVHCGFCLPSCPTYQLWGEEMDSPRGRIHLISQLLDGANATQAAATHLDRCLGCMACVPACPSGVRYDKLIEAARSWSTEPPVSSTTGPVQALPPRSPRERALRAAIFATFPYPARLRLLMAPLRAAQRTRLDRLMQRNLAERLAPEISAAMKVAPGRPAKRAPRGHLPARVAARGPRRAVVGMLTGCVQQVFFPEVNIATARVLAAEGCDVLIPPAQGCCGALSLHDGRTTEADRFASALIKEFNQAGVDAIVVNSAGCGSAMKEYEDTTFSAKVKDFSEFLADLGPAAQRHPLALKAAYHDACHLAHAQGITKQPRDLLKAIPDLELVELPDAGTCCGSAGIYNLVQPATAAELGKRKAESVESISPDLVVSANPGCALQIKSSLQTPIPVLHIAELLDASIRSTHPSSLLRQH